MATQEIPSYADLLAVLDALPTLVREARRRRGQSMREAATVCRLSASTISRLESGSGDLSLSAVRALLRYVS